MMKKIALSAGMLLFVGAVVATGTGAFFSDTETSTGNTFTAGALDLKVDSDCHYYQNGVDVGCGPVTGEPGVGIGQWAESDLVPGVHRFFDFNDIKPGDRGETTISLHVYDNDAWGAFEVVPTGSLDNTCTEPEVSAEPNCALDNDGELDNTMTTTIWLDQGAIPGFQNVDANGDPVDGDLITPGVQPVDATEGDNIWQEGEPVLGTGLPFFGQVWRLNTLLAGAYDTFCSALDQNQQPLFSPTGANNYGPCQGIADDGRMVGSTTYYIGWQWDLPASVGNEAQTDSIGGTVNFYVVQHRNNAGQSGIPGGEF